MPSKGWIASDDNGELWLSSDHRLADLARIAHVPGWSGVEQWDRFPEQRSAPIPLRGGQAYAFEALMKEGAGGDHLALAWAPVTADGVGEPTLIGAESLRPWRGANAPPVVRDGAQTVPPDLTSTIQVTGSDPDGDRWHVISAEADQGAPTIDGMTLGYTPPAGYEGPATVAVVIGDGHGGEAQGQIRLAVFEGLRVEPIEPLDRWMGGDSLRFDWAPVPGGQADAFTVLWQRDGVIERYLADDRGPFGLCAVVGDGPLDWSIEANRRGDPRTFANPGGAVMVDQTGPHLDRNLIERPEGASCVPGPLTIR